MKHGVPVVVVSTALMLLLAPPAEAAAQKKSKKTRNEGIPLVWNPTTEIGELDPIPLTGITSVRIAVAGFEDERTGDPTQIGVNEEDDRPKLVTTPDSVPDFVAEHTAALLSRLGLRVVDSPAAADVVLSGMLRRFFVIERNTYQSEVLFVARLESPDGEPLFEALATGSAKRFGRSYKDENYYETLSDALIDAVHGLMLLEEFREALRAAADGP